MPASRHFLSLIVWSCLAAVCVVPTFAVTIGEVSWETLTGGDIEFEIEVQNPGPDPSEPIEGEIDAQPFGAFVDSVAFVCEFEVPSLGPGGDFTVFCLVSREELPQSAPLIIPDGTAGGGDQPCAPDDFWSGGLGINWTGDGGGEADIHRATFQVCPDEMASYIQVVMECGDGGGVSWSFSDLCPGWNATLVNLDFSPAPNPLPAGPFLGWVEVTASGVPFGDTCDIIMDTLCGSMPGAAWMGVEACDCDTPLPAESSTWGEIKRQYED